MKRAATGAAAQASQAVRVAICTLGKLENKADIIEWLDYHQYVCPLCRVLHMMLHVLDCVVAAPNSYCMHVSCVSGRCRCAHAKEAEK